MSLLDLLTTSIFSNTISKFLYFEKINNIYTSCKSLRKFISSESKYIYSKVCLHHQPHGIYDKDDIYSKDGYAQVSYKEGKLHGEGDLPAIISTEGKFWYKNGLRHRDGDLPAI